MTRESSHERYHRERRATALLAIIDLLDNAPTADEAADWGAGVWETMSKCAALKTPPSPKTIALVVAKLREREGAPISETRRSA